MARKITKLAHMTMMDCCEESLPVQASLSCQGEPGIHFRPTSIPGKRLFDLLFASVLLLILSPLYVLLMLVVKFDSHGPTFFSQKRLGRYGKEFSCYKFRTMYEDNQIIMEKHLRDFPASQKSWAKFSKLRKNDPRVTRAGKYLRSWSLDELPQLLNVLKGDMSLVGPRPYLLEEGAEMGGMAAVILAVLPGLTGLWQVNGRNEISFLKRMELEAWYVHNRSLRMDIAILFRTIPVVLSRKGAY
ncbi:MAG: sugar transferase [Syntrophomonas sp.]|nr:sugar transferase [Syntrophomonas sp.]